jgi:hypothetical protein
MFCFNSKKLYLKFKFIILSIFFSFFFSLNSFAFENTNYSVPISGIFHDVTVAFDDLNDAGNIRCVIKRM